MRHNGATAHVANAAKSTRGALVGAKDHQQRALRAALSEQQQAFTVAFVRNGGNASAAAKEAGYAEPSQIAYALMRVPMVLLAIRAEQARVIGADLATVAIGT